jgi:hypothetical protein
VSSIGLYSGVSKFIPKYPIVKLHASGISKTPSWKEIYICIWQITLNSKLLKWIITCNVFNFLSPFLYKVLRKQILIDD